MIYYVAHKYGGDKENIEKARKICHDLAKADPDNTYITPLTALSHLGYNELSYECEMDQCADLLSVCDKLIVASEISKGVQFEINMAELFRMEVEYLT